MTDSRLERVIVVPRNGYINRLQAWASSAILAQDMGVNLHVMWDPEEGIASASANDLFDPAFVRDRFISADTVTDIVGGQHSDLPRYLTRDDDRGLLILAGHDRGEQSFMARLVDQLHGPASPSTLVVIAGGKFALPTTTNFQERRGEFYRSLDWHVEIRERVRQSLADREPYYGLHIRGTDRSRDAPTTLQIRRALHRLLGEGRSRSLFITADTPQSRSRWMGIAEQTGFLPWVTDHDIGDRGITTAGLDAMVDWQILAGSIGSTYSRTSTFGEEAAIAGDYADVAIPLRAPVAIRAWRDASAWGHALMTYPKRHRVR